MIDSHCHLDHEPLFSNLNKVIERSKKVGIEKILTICTTFHSFTKIKEILEKDEIIFGTYGIHPHEAKEVTIDYRNELKNKAHHKKVVAIGEIGLDYHYNFSDPIIQKKIFMEQLELANELDLPAIVHCRESDDDLYSCIKDSKNHKGVIHCFASNLEFAKKNY